MSMSLRGDSFLMARFSSQGFPSTTSARATLTSVAPTGLLMVSCPCFAASIPQLAMSTRFVHDLAYRFWNKVLVAASDDSDALMLSLLFGALLLPPSHQGGGKRPGAWPCTGPILRY